MLGLGRCRDIAVREVTISRFSAVQVEFDLGSSWLHAYAELFLARPSDISDHLVYKNLGQASFTAHASAPKYRAHFARPAA